MRVQRSLMLWSLLFAVPHAALPAQLSDEPKRESLCRIATDTSLYAGKEIVVSGLLGVTVESIIRLQDAACGSRSLYIVGSLSHHGAGWEQWNDLVRKTVATGGGDKMPVTLMGRINRLSNGKTVFWQLNLDGVIAIDGIPPTR